MPQLLCTIPGCDRPTAFSSGKGLARYHCRYHVQRKARHGSHWHSTYRASELKPYLWAAALWLQAHRSAHTVVAALESVEHILAASGSVDPAFNLRGQSAAYRSRIAFARLREAGVRADRLLAIYLAVSALIEDDLGSHRTREFRIVQAAKAAHRLASGTHKRWEMWNPVGSPVKTELHAYPRSSGLVLRKIGSTLEEASREIPDNAIAAIIETKTAKFGHHSSHHPLSRAVGA